MAFIKLFPFEGNDWLPKCKIIQRLESEFGFVEIDEEEGKDHVGEMIAATLRFSDNLPGKQERLASLQEAQNQAVFLAFGDNPPIAASFCLMPDSELFFGSPDEVDGPARPLVERAAKVLNYEFFES